jgi:hypothetical protein
MGDFDEMLARYEALVAGHDGVGVKGKKMPYTATGGNMFSFLAPDGQLCLRLSPEDKAAFEAAHGTGDVVQYGAVMRGYVPVPAPVFQDDGALAEWFGRSLAFARGLKPKPQKA